MAMPPAQGSTLPRRRTAPEVADLRALNAKVLGTALTLMPSTRWALAR